MKKLICFLGGALLLSNVQAQLGRSIDFRKMKELFYIDSWMNQDIPLGKIINYKKTTASLNDFKGKMIILDFWFTHCTDCIAEFPKEDSLQKVYGNNIQFILVTFDSETQVKKFLAEWQTRNGIRLSFPIVVEDTILTKVFRHLYDPHYAWVFPDGKIVGQTAQQFITRENIEGMLKQWQKRKTHQNALQKKHQADLDKTKTNNHIQTKDK